MADLSSNSFIPKRGPVKHSRGTASRKVYVFTLISYVLMFATLLATGSVYLYAKYVDKQLESEVSALNTEINSFSEADMQKVLDFDRRLTQAYDRLNNSVSIVSVFEALESATIDTVKVKTLDIVRENDEKFILSATVETDSFDSTIFQRGVYQRNQTIESVMVSGVQAAVEDSGSEDSGSEEDVDLYTSPISFSVQLEVPLSAVPYVDSSDQVQPITITQPTIDQVDLTEEVDSNIKTDNEENI